jgi:DNA-binding transcriptional LysR family regulator
MGLLYYSGPSRSYDELFGFLIADLDQATRQTSGERMENFRLKVFRVVASHLNFSRAAEELLLTQPAVTQQIKALEEEYGVPLFDRSGGKIALTPSGKVLLPFANRLKEVSEEAYAAVAHASGKLAGHLALGASQTIGQYLLPAFIAGFLRENPRVSISAISGNTDEILQALSAHRIELALIEGPALRKDVHIEPFMEDHIVLVVPASHEWAGQDVELAALVKAQLLMREFGSGSRRVVEKAFASAGISPKQLNIRMELDSTESLLSAVEAGLGVTFVSQWAARNHLALGTLKVARTSSLKLSRKFSIVYSAGPAPSGNPGAFRAHLLARGMEQMSKTSQTGRHLKR